MVGQDAWENGKSIEIEQSVMTRVVWRRDVPSLGLHGVNAC